jgi:hypothetical protein
MALESVELLILSDAVTPAPVAGVVVRVFDSTGTTFITSATSDVAGLVDFTVNVPGVSEIFQLRFYKASVSFTSPQRIEVFSPAAGSPTGTNTFETSAHVQVMAEAVDPLFCRLSGFVVLPDGRPYQGLRVHWIFNGSPQAADGRGVLGERVTTATDRTGFMQVELLRGGCYNAMVVSDHQYEREIVIPDAPAVNVIHVLYPQIATIVWSPPTSLTVGTTVSFPLIATTFAGVELRGTANGDLDFSVDHPERLAVSTTDELVVVTALAPGPVVLRAQHKNKSIRYVPSSGDITGGTASITVV